MNVDPARRGISRGCTFASQCLLSLFKFVALVLTAAYLGTREHVDDLVLKCTVDVRQLAEHGDSNQAHVSRRTTTYSVYTCCDVKEPEVVSHIARQQFTDRKSVV